MKIEYKIIDGPNEGLGWGTNTSKTVTNSITGFSYQEESYVPVIHDTVQVTSGPLTGKYVVVGKSIRVEVDPNNDIYTPIQVILLRETYDVDL